MFFLQLPQKPSDHHEESTETPTSLLLESQEDEDNMGTLMPSNLFS